MAGSGLCMEGEHEKIQLVVEPEAGAVCVQESRRSRVISRGDIYMRLQECPVLWLKTVIIMMNDILLIFNNIFNYYIPFYLFSNFLLSSQNVHLCAVLAKYSPLVPEQRRRDQGAGGVTETDTDHPDHSHSRSCDSESQRHPLRGVQVQ